MSRFSVSESVPMKKTQELRGIDEENRVFGYINVISSTYLYQAPP
jgi:hypothetical protein